MTTTIKGNRPLRIFASMMLILLAIAHFMEQIDLTEISFLWVMIAMAINAIQASFTGFCPMFKNARGECVACGVVCDSAECKPDTHNDSHTETHSETAKKTPCGSDSSKCGDTSKSSNQ